MAHADITLFLEEPYGRFGAMNPTGHAAVYFSRVCAETPLILRRCQPDEPGAVISRYHRIGGYDWIAIPLIPYLYAVDQADRVPTEVSAERVASLRDDYRRAHLEAVAPDQSDGSMPEGDWTQLVGEAYDRTIYAFGIETSPEQDDELIRAFNSQANRNRFHLLFSNCADFARKIIDFYYPHAVRRDFSADLGIMTPKQTAKCLMRYGGKHPDLQFSIFTIAQISGTIPRSSAVRGVLESLMKSKKYAVPLTALAVLHPAVGGGLAYALVEESHFDPRRQAGVKDEPSLQPGAVLRDLESKDGEPSATVPRVLSVR
jgi:hypothetical protein